MQCAETAGATEQAENGSGAQQAVQDPNSARARRGENPDQAQYETFSRGGESGIQAAEVRQRDKPGNQQRAAENGFPG